MALNDRVHVRVSRYEKQQLDRYHIDASKVCRRALYAKIREFVTDPDLVRDDGFGPAAVYVSAFNTIWPGIISFLTEEDYKILKNSQERLVDLQKLVAPFMKPLELENLGIFLQGGDISKRVLDACLDQKQLSEF
ncbi:hypothetical protein [uncultured Methanoregula sp.]|uniref:hypothetical protein n=1 Tax=uncultured Methanoregula sp. TaxID=1005933 RepID=UPI002AABDEF9|nr:hypothetical protein [uncultured Methanoregula sp.]